MTATAPPAVPAQLSHAGDADADEELQETPEKAAERLLFLVKLPAWEAISELHEDCPDLDDAAVARLVGALVPQIATYGQLLENLDKRVTFRGRVVSVHLGMAGHEGQSHALLRVELEGSSETVAVVSRRVTQNIAGIVEVDGRVAQTENPAARWRGNGDHRHPTNPLPAPHQPFIEDAHVRPAALTGYRPTLGDREDFTTVFGGITNDNAARFADALIAPHIIGRADEKLACLLTALSPVGVPIDGDDRFTLKALLYGDSREAKDAIAGDVCALCPAGAVSVNAEMANLRGLVGAVHEDRDAGWTVAWGRLVETDCGLLHVSGLNQLGGDVIASLREVWSQGRASVEKIVKATRDARARILLTANPRLHVVDYPTSFAALLDIADSDGQPLFRHDADLYRIHLPLVFARATVPLDERDEAKDTPRSRTLPADLIRRKIADTWRGGDLEPTAWRAALPRIRDGVGRLRDVAGDLPLSAAGPEGMKVVAALAIAAAELRYRVSDDEHNRVIRVVPDDVELAVVVVERAFRRLGVAKVVQDEAARTAAAAKHVALLTAPMNMTPDDRDALERYSACLRALWKAMPTRVPAVQLADEAGMSRATFFRDRGRAEEVLERKLGALAEPLIEGHQRAGFCLTTLGRLVAKGLPPSDAGAAADT